MTTRLFSGHEGESPEEKAERMKELAEGLERRQKLREEGKLGEVQEREPVLLVQEEDESAQEFKRRVSQALKESLRPLTT